jgi:hypothetical protein
MIRAALALPEECFVEALGDVGFPGVDDAAGGVAGSTQDRVRSMIESTLEQFREILRIRKEFIEQLRGCQKRGQDS